MVTDYVKGKMYRFIGNYTWSQFIDKYTIDINHVQFTFEGIIYNGTSKTFYKTSDGIPWWYQQVVTESVISFMPLAKCFTMFSAINQQWKDIKTSVDKIILSIPTSYQSVFIVHSYFYFSIHSPNSFPSLNEMRLIKIKSIAEIDYSMTKTTLLNSRYNTDCLNYNLDYRYANYNMRSDCITTCEQRESSCQGKILSNRMIRTQALKYYPSLEVCSDTDLQRYDLYCIDRCKKDCTFRYYNYHVKSMENRKNYTYMIIMHNTMPDFSITHLPEMTFISLVCYFGGLLGLWLGLNVLSLTNTLITCVMIYLPNTKFKINLIKSKLINPQINLHLNVR
jgi:hypothetical protein